MPENEAQTSFGIVRRAHKMGAKALDVTSK